ncbi:hypothetical protein EV361DRAFT_925049 [Lentinula raphanica]|nr:hypothetical protein EV360DRAFT_82827 [Lentinula raphanica]KAJ3824998.1 hypothetical protein F5880DRAFT_1555765 [Lentinula raphanica]KAJ3968643.1 hypothetical protein EV361DRAFT_925049 [Lentinula raphanica]
MRSIFSPIVLLFTVCILSLHIFLADALPAPPEELRDPTIPCPSKKVEVKPGIVDPGGTTILLIWRLLIPMADPRRYIIVGYMKGSTDSLVFKCGYGYHVWTKARAERVQVTELAYRKLRKSEIADTADLGISVAPEAVENIILDNADAATIQKLQQATGQYQGCRWMIETIYYLLSMSMPRDERKLVPGFGAVEKRIRGILEGVEKAQSEKEGKTWSSSCGQPIDSELLFKYLMRQPF